MALKQSYKGQHIRPQAVSKPQPRPNKGKPISPKSAKMSTPRSPKGGRR